MSSILRRWIVPTAGLSAALLLVIPAATALPAGDLKIAVVDIGKVFENHPQQQKANDELKAEAERRKAAYDALLDSIQALKMEQREVDRSSVRWAEIEREVLKKKEEAKVRKRDSERAMNTEAVKMMQKFLVEIEETIQKYCKQNAITICIKADAGPAMEPGMDLALKSVIYYDGSVDITDAISKIIRKKHEPGAAGGEPEKPAGESRSPGSAPGGASGD